MSEQAAAQPKAPAIEDKDFSEVLRSLMGKTITVVNPESYEDAPVGHQIRAGFYRAKPTGMGHDYLIVVAEFVHSGREAGKEPVKQYIPFRSIKRVSVLKAEILLHI